MTSHGADTDADAIASSVSCELQPLPKRLKVAAAVESDAAQEQAEQRLAAQAAVITAQQAIIPLQPLQRTLVAAERVPDSTPVPAVCRGHE